MIHIITESPEQTIELGRRIAGLLKPGAVVALSGDLGCGKTTLVKGIASGLGIDPAQVHSPTFVLIHEYSGRKMDLYHADLYRLEGSLQVEFSGIEDYFSRKGILVIEWAKKAKDILPDEYLEINIGFVSKFSRKFSFSADGEKYCGLLKKIKGMKAGKA